VSTSVKASPELNQRRGCARADDDARDVEDENEEEDACADDDVVVGDDQSGGGDVDDVVTNERLDIMTQRAHRCAGEQRG
jgi:hypothetical protein